MSRLIGCSIYQGVVAIDGVKLSSQVINLPALGVLGSAPIVPMPRGLFQIIIQDTGIAAPGDEIMFFVKGGLSTQIGNTSGNYNALSPTINATLTSAGPNSIVVTNTANPLQMYGLLFNSIANTFTITDINGSLGPLVITITGFV
jgi:hypothetical protein